MRLFHLIFSRNYEQCFKFWVVTNVVLLNFLLNFKTLIVGDDLKPFHFYGKLKNFKKLTEGWMLNTRRETRVQAAGRKENKTNLKPKTTFSTWNLKPRSRTTGGLKKNLILSLPLPSSLSLFPAKLSF